MRRDNKRPSYAGLYTYAVSIPPNISVSSFMGYLKEKSALMIFDRHANLKNKFGNRHFCSEGYYVSAAGSNEVTIRKYVQEQEAHVSAINKFSLKGYEDILTTNALKGLKL